MRPLSKQEQQVNLQDEQVSQCIHLHVQHDQRILPGRQSPGQHILEIVLNPQFVQSLSQQCRLGRVEYFGDQTINRNLLRLEL